MSWEEFGELTNVERAEAASRPLGGLCLPRPARTRLRDAPVGTGRTVLTEALASRPITVLGASVMGPGSATEASR